MNNIPYDDQKFLEYVKAKRKKRQCLRCNRTFISPNSGIRRCDSCRIYAPKYHCKGDNFIYVETIPKKQT